jgi:hypothetical protein
MTIVKFSPKNHDVRFVIVPTTLAQAAGRLSLEAIGMAVYLSSLPPAWEVRPGHLARAWGIGRDKVRRIFKELEDYGILVRRCHQDARGRWAWSTRIDVRPAAGKSVDGAPVDGGGAHIEKIKKHKKEIKNKQLPQLPQQGGGGLDPELLRAIDDEVLAQVEAGVARHPERLHNYLTNKALSGGGIYATSWRREMLQRRAREEAAARASEDLARRRAASIATVAAQTAAPLSRDFDRIFGTLRAAMRGGVSLPRIEDAL